MTTYDELIGSDLDRLGADNRRGVGTVDDVLQAIDARRRPARSAPLRDELVMVRLAQVFALRVARAATGAVALLITLGLFRLLCRPDVPRYDGWPDGDDFMLALLQNNSTTIVLSIALLLLVSYATAGQLARRWFERRLRAAGATGAPPEAHVQRTDRLLRRVDHASIALWLAGLPAVVLVVGTAAFSVGREQWSWLLYIGDDARMVMIELVRGIALASAGGVIAALVICRGCALERRWLAALEHPATIALVAALGLATVGVGLARGVHPLSTDTLPVAMSPLPPVALAMLTLALAMICAALRRRRRELRDLQHVPSPSVANLALVAPAGIFADRVARIASGAVAGLGALVVLIAFHRPLTAAAGPRSIVDSIERVVVLWSRERAVLVASMIIAIVVVQQLARHVASRRFIRQLARLDAQERTAGARRLAHRIDGRSAGIGAGGAAALGSLLSVASIAAGGEFWAFFESHGPRLTQVMRIALHVMSPAVPLAFVIGVGVGRVAACNVRGGSRLWLVRVLESCRMFELSLALTVVTVVMGAALDFGIRDVSAPATVPPATLQLVLSLVSVLAILTLSLSYMLRRRKREQARLA